MYPLFKVVCITHNKDRGHKPGLCPYQRGRRRRRRRRHVIILTVASGSIQDEESAR